MMAATAATAIVRPHLLVVDAMGFPLVQPLAIFAAGRRSFEVLVRALVSGHEALACIFVALPMADNGWDFDHTEIVKVRTRFGFPIWRVSRE